MMNKIDRELSLLSNDRYGAVALISICFELWMGCPDREIRVKVDTRLQFLGKNREIFKKRRKGNYTKFLLLKYLFQVSFMKK